MTLVEVSRTLSVSGAALPMYGGQSLLTPVRLTGGETIGELFEYVLELKTPDALAFSPSVAANVDLDALIGTEVTVSIQLEGRGHFIPGLAGSAGMGNIGAGMREITGIVSQATIVREEGRSIVYALTLRPWLWHATKNSDCR
ncbi:phage late control D family protein, partial [Burkholderia multivorans]